MTEKSNLLDDLKAEAEKRYGVGTVFTGNEMKKDPPRLPTGIFSVDYAAGGGLPIWGSTCFWGPQGGGKTSMAIGAMQMVPRICWRCFNLLERCSCSEPVLKMRTMWADVEGTLDRDWAAALGANPDDYLVTLADYGEQYVNIMESALRADDCGLVVCDSLAALTPAAEFDAPSEDQFIGNQARMITRCVRKLKQRLIRERKREHPCTVLFTNQLRIKIGVMFGDNESMPGGEGMKHEFSLLLRCVKKALKKDGPDAKFLDATRKMNMAQRHSFAVRKEKVLTMAGIGEFVRVRENLPAFELQKGMIDDYTTVLTYAKEYGVVFKEKDKWRLFEHTAKKQDDIKLFWKKRPGEYFLAQQEIIKRAKERLGGAG
uniref:Putative RecA n=1 Tax=viral metagenome TaxID=1070528 RepID=A0A6M3M0Q9_9ZZZZ